MRKGLSPAALALLLVLVLAPTAAAQAPRRHRLRPVRVQGVPHAVPQRHEPHRQGPQEPDRPAPPPARRARCPPTRTASASRSPSTTATTASAPASRSSCASRASTRASAFKRSRLVPLADLGQSFAKRAGVVVINARTRKRQLIYAELDANAKRASDKMLLIHPGENFDEGARYIVALRGLRTASGKKIKASKGFRALKDGKGPKRLRKRYKGIFKTLKRAGIAKSNLKLAWDFTVASEKGLTVAHAPHPRRRVRPARRPQPRRRQGRGQRAAVHDHQGRRQPRPADPAPHLRHVHRCRATSTRRAARPARSSTTRARARTRSRPSGPATRRPRSSSARSRSPRSTTPAHAALYGHGLLGGPDEIDGTEHQGDMSQEHDFAFCATAWSGMSAEDIPNAVKLLGDLSGFASLPDRHQQGFLNQIYLGRLLIHPQGLTANPAFAGPRRPVAALLRRQQPGRHPRHRADRDGARLHARGARRARDQLLGAADPQLELGHLRRGLQPRLPAPGRPPARALADQPAVGPRRGRRLGAPRHHRPAGGHARPPRADARRGRRLPGHDLPGRRARAHGRRLRAQAGLPPRPLARAGADVPHPGDDEPVRGLGARLLGQRAGAAGRLDRQRADAAGEHAAARGQGPARRAAQHPGRAASRSRSSCSPATWSTCAAGRPAQSDYTRP